MSQKYTKNDSKLSQYILGRSKAGKGLPYMTVIAAESGVSVATISRYAKRKGFYSFAEMRATFNKGLISPTFNDFGLVEKIQKAKKITVVSSDFSKVIGEYIHARLKYLKKNIEIIGKEDFDKHIDEIPKSNLIICISMTGWSLRVEKTIKRKIDNDVVLLTAANYKSKRNKLTVISLEEYKMENDEHFEGWKTIRNVYNWVDDVLNIYHLKLK